MKVNPFFKVTRLRLMVLTAAIVFVFLGCNSASTGNSKDSQNGKGSLSFQIAIDRPSSQARKAMISADMDICAYFGIITIQATVFDSGQKNLASATWACSDHQGTLDEVPAGSNYRIVVKGIETGTDHAGWTGEATGITVSSGVGTDAGEITLEYTDPLPSPENITVIPGDGSAMISWHAIRRATGYIVNWGTSSGNYEGTLPDITTTYALIPELTNGTTYYFTVSSHNTIGDSDYSPEITAVPQPAPHAIDQISLETPGGASGEFGWGVASGDFNGDGLVDIAVSDPVYDGVNSNTGAVCIYLGDTDFQTAPSQTIQDPDGTAGDEFGFYISGVGDTNGDGFDDLLVAMNWGVNKAYLLYGSTSGLSTANLTELLPPTSYDGYGFGHVISGGGDVNGDGYHDFVVATGGGFGCIYYGSSSGVGVYPNHVLSIGNDATNSMLECAIIGDINDDGYDDVALNNNSPGPINSTTVFIYHGSGSGVNTPNDTMTIYINEAKDYGFSVAINSAGDFSGDGFDDMLIGNQWATYTATNQGEGRLYFGSSMGLYDSALILPNPYYKNNSRFGNSVAGIGDFNYDGYDDVIIGCPYDNFAEIYLGSENPSVDLSSLTLHGASSYGWSVSKAGDIRGTGENFAVIGSEFGAAEVAATHNDRPTAQAGADQVIETDVACQLDGRMSSDGDSDILSYQWIIISSPAGSSPVLSDAQSPTPLLYMDLPGQYTLELTVDDNIVESEPDEVVITRN